MRGKICVRREKHMICKNCGSELQAGAIFCQSCGTKVEEPVNEAAAPAAAEQQAQEAPKAEQQAQEAPKAEQQVQEAPKAEQQAQAVPKAEQQAQEAPKAEQQVQAVPQSSAQAEETEVKKKSPLIGIIAAVAALVIIVLVFLGFKAMAGLGGNKGETSNAVAYVSKDTLCVILDTTVKDPKVFEVCDIKIPDSMGYYPTGIVTWSDDEKYIYFFNDIKDSGCGDLCRIQVSKLGKDKDKNESKVQEIDDNVYYGSLIILDDGRLVYVTGKDRLKIFDGKESEEIRKDVEFPDTVSDGKGLVYLGDEEEGTYTLFYLNLADLSETEIDNEVANIYLADEDMVYFAKTDTETWNTELYVADYSSFDAVEISDSVEARGPVTDNGFYYTESVQNTVCLYDYINDPYAAGDDEAVQPVYPSKDAGFVEADPGDVFDKSKQKTIAERFGGNCVEYMDEYCWTYTYGDEEYYSIYNNDTDEDYYYLISKDKYFTYDSALYDKALEKYNEDTQAWYDIRDRISLRQSLKDYNVDLEYYTLNYYCDGSSKELVSECADVDFVYSSGTTPIAVYQISDKDDITKINIDEIEYSYEAYDRLFGYGNSEYGDLYYAIGSDAGHALDLTGSVYSTAFSDKDSRLALSVNYVDKKDNVEKEVYLYSLKGTELTLDDKFEDEADCVAGFKDGLVYFIKGADGEEGDLYIYDGKENTKLIKNVALNEYGYVYENGSIIIGMDGKYVLYDKAGNEIVKLGSIDSVRLDVNRISDKKITFLSDGKLRYYDGKEIIKIAGNVDMVWFAKRNSSTYLSY